MIETLFGRIAAEAGWSDAGRIAVLLRYAARRGTPETFAAFLADERADEGDTVTHVIEKVITLLRDPGLALDPAFRGFCARSHDLLTPRQIAERWCCWRAG